MLTALLLSGDLILIVGPGTMRHLLCFLFYFCSAIQLQAVTIADWTAGAISSFQELCAPGTATLISNEDHASPPSGFSLSYLWKYSYIPPQNPDDYNQWAFVPGATGSTLLPGFISQDAFYVRVACIRRCRQRDTLYSNVSQVKLAAVFARVLTSASPNNCAGDSVQLIADSPYGSTINWNNGSSDTAIYVSTSGLYSFQFTTSSGCSGSSDILRVSVGILTSDLNADGTVNIDDFIILNSYFNTNCSGCPADQSLDGFVNNYDFLLFARDFGRTCSNPTVSVGAGLKD